MNEDQARQRFFLMTAARIGGVILVVLGIAIARGAISLHEWLGHALIVLGLFEVFFMPTLLARRWKSPPE